MGNSLGIDFARTVRNDFFHSYFVLLALVMVVKVRLDFSFKYFDLNLQTH